MEPAILVVLGFAVGYTLGYFDVATKIKHFVKLAIGFFKIRKMN